MLYCFKAQKVRIWIEEIEEDTKVVKRLHAVVLHSPRTDQGKYIFYHLKGTIEENNCYILYLPN